MDIKNKIIKFLEENNKYDTNKELLGNLINISVDINLRNKLFELIDINEFINQFNFNNSSENVKFLKIFCNYLTNNNKNEYIFNILFVNMKFIEFFNENIQNIDYLKILLILVHNYALNSKELNSLLDDKLFIYILNKCLNTYFLIEFNELNDELSEWVNLIFINFFRLNKTNKISLFEFFYDKLNNKVKFIDYIIFWMEYIIKEKTSYSLVRNCESLIDNNIQNYEGIVFQINLNDYSFIINKFKQNSINFIELFNDFDNLKIEDYLINHIKPFWKILIMISYLGGYNKNIQKLLFNDEIDNSIFSLLLKQLSLIQIKIYVPKINLNEDAFYELNSNYVRLITNIISDNIKAQNYILENNYLLSILANTGRDKFNVHGKEVIVVFVKEMTMSNPKAVEAIGDVKMNDFDITYNENFINKVEL